MSAWPRAPKAPWWFTVLLVLVAFPTVAFIPQAAHILEEAEWLGSSYVGWVYPVYVLLSAFLAWISYPTRRTLAWILFALIILTDIGLFLTVCLI